METVAQALEAIYRSHRQGLFTCALAVTRRAELAEDAVHEAFVNLMRRQAVPENCKAYVFRAVRNAAIDLLRRTPIREDELNEFVFDSSHNPNEKAEDVEFQQRVTETLLALSENERETIVQHLYADLTFREIAEVQGCALGTVTAWYRRGMEKLRNRLEAAYGRTGK